MLGTRALLDKELTHIRDNIIRLGDMVDQAIDRAMLALNGRNLALAHEVVAGDEEVNNLRYEIETECLRVLATQQPAAGDLRTVVTAIHLTVELERIGDHASGIARLVERLEEEEEIDSLHKLPKMARRARQMVHDGITAFIQHDADMACALIKQDDKIDKQYNRLFRETLEEMRDENYIRRANFLLWAGHNLERIGDRATNIAERVIFMVTGEFVEVPFDTDDH
ncbi:MAG: phosphate signaling complex protein PhoU [Ardenticatenaceae bacterium]|nr:phosphate signaling complex protein PhoU [Ardenticatenaceae bacterium]